MQGVDVEQWPLTRASLLVRIQEATDHEAWCCFVNAYGPVVYQYARRQGLQDADAADVTQDVLQRLAQAMSEAKFDKSRGSFRGWLFTIARNRVRSWQTAAGHNAKGTGDTNFQQFLEQFPASQEESQAWDIEYERHLLFEAARQVRSSFTPTTWDAFWQTAVEGKNVKEVAQALGISVGAVYVAKSRVLARIRAELERCQAAD